MHNLELVNGHTEFRNAVLECLALVTYVGDISDLRSYLSYKLLDLKVDQTNRQSLGVDNDSSLSVYLTHERSCNCSDNSFISDGANRYSAQATGAAPGIKSIWNSIGRAGGRPGKSLGNTSGKSRTIGTSLICFLSDLSPLFFLADICAKKRLGILWPCTLDLLN
ncbi:hypothetical protein Tco_0151538 [Tanacetum coccineum]